MQPEAVDPFVGSLRNAGYRGSIVLFVAHCSDEVIASLLERVDEVVVVTNETGRLLTFASRVLRRMRTTRGLRSAYHSAFKLLVRVQPKSRRPDVWRALEFELQGLQSLRYWCYDEFLRSRPGAFRQILIADVRDVVFQRPPFEKPVNSLEVFLETPRFRLGTPGFNRSWGEDLYGAAWSAFHDEPVSCSGTTAGDEAAMLDYVAVMAAEIARSTQAMGPHDQAVHNWLLNTGRLPDARRVENGTGRVLTVDAQDPPELAADRTVRNADGSIVPVVHQYDRVEALVEAFLQR